MKRRLWCAEQHGEVLAKWNQLGFKEKTVICFDRHFDFKRIAPDRLVRLSAAADNPVALADGLRWCPFTDTPAHVYGSDDFLYAAVSLGMVKHVVWVYPEFHESSNDALAGVFWESLRLLPGHGDEILQTIKRSNGLLSASIGNARVSICTASALPLLLDDSAWHLDIDLDYFWDDESCVLHNTIDTVAAVTREFMPADCDVTAAYSISSGYLPEQCRWLGDHLGRALGCEYYAIPTRRFPVFEEWAALLGRQSTGKDCTPTPDDSACVPVVPGTRHALRALLALSAGDVEMAEHLHELAQKQGDRATWPSYKLGLHFLGQRHYRKAAVWFRRTCIDMVDSIQAHSLCLLALCEYRLGHYEEALDVATTCIRLLPMCEEGYVVASRAAPHVPGHSHAALTYAHERDLVEARRLSLEQR